MEKPTVYIIPGDRITSLDSFYQVIGEVINGPGGYFGANLDALDDCFAGGFGTPEGPYILRWSHSAESRVALGYPETVRQLEERLTRCHPSGQDSVEADLEGARRGEGPTVFDWLVEIIRCQSHITLELE